MLINVAQLNQFNFQDPSGVQRLPIVKRNRCKKKVALMNVQNVTPRLMMSRLKV